MAALMTCLDGITYQIPLIPASDSVLFHYSVSNRIYALGENETITVPNCTESRTYNVKVTLKWKSAIPDNVYRIYLARNASQNMFSMWFNAAGGYRKWCYGQSNSNFVSGQTFQVTCDGIDNILFNYDKVESVLEYFDIWIW